jgi:hypothetical protein
MKKLSLLILCVILSCRLFATHVAVAELRYEYTGTANDYKISLTVIKACEPFNANLNNVETVTIGSSCSLNYNLTMPLLSIDTLEEFCPGSIGSCTVPGSPFPGYVKRVYEAVTSLSPCNDWLMRWSLCCRNAGIVNLDNPGGNETYVEAFLDNSGAINTSAWIPNPAPFSVSLGNNTVIPMHTVDAEDDSVSYEWYQPMTINAVPIPYASSGGYSLADPFGTGGSATIDALNQQLIFNSPTSGKFALAMKISEYRNGQLVGYTMRDFQVVAYNSSAPLTVPMPVTGSNLHYVTCPGQSNSITINFTDATSTDYITPDVTLPAITGWTFTATTIPGTGSASTTISWATPLTMNPATLPHFYFKIKAYDNSCPAIATADYAVVVQNIQCNTDSVWAGDANGDYTVNVYDPLAIAVAYGTSDVPRPGATTTWQAEYCPAWAYTFSNTVDMKHADCNGDGTVDNADLPAVTANYGLVHLKGGIPQAKTTSDPDLYFDVTGISFTPGASVSVPIKLGTSAVMMNNIYGLAANIGVSNLTLTSPATVTYPQSWLANTANSIRFEKTISNGNIDWAYARNDHQQVSGQGTIANLNFTVPLDAIDGTQVGLDLSQVMLINTNGEEIPDFNVIPQTITVDAPTSIHNVSGNISAVIIPNPSGNAANLRIAAEAAAELEITVSDLTGKTLRTQIVKVKSGNNNISLPAENLASGVYLINIRHRGQQASSLLKWIKQ